MSLSHGIFKIEADRIRDSSMVTVALVGSSDAEDPSGSCRIWRGEPGRGNVLRVL